MNDISQKEAEEIRDKAIEEIKKVYDPEIPVNLYDLGLIYRMEIIKAENGKYDIELDMTLTAPACPMAEELPVMVKEAVESLVEAGDVSVNLVWSPPWDPSRMSEDAKIALDIF